MPLLLKDLHFLIRDARPIGQHGRSSQNARRLLAHLAVPDLVHVGSLKSVGLRGPWMLFGRLEFSTKSQNR